MSLRVRIIVFVSAIVFVILTISVYLFINGKKKPAAQQVYNPPQVIDSQNFNNVNLPTTQPTALAGVQMRKPTKEEDELRFVKELGRTFVERYNTFSTENNYQNIRDVQSMVTDNYWSEIGAPLKKPQASPTEFSAVTVTVISMSGSVKGNYGTVEIGARKITQKGGASVTTNVNYSVSLIKSNSNWLVSGQTVK